MSPARWLTLLFAACSLASAGLVARESWELRGYPDPVHGAAVPTACAGVTEGVVLGRVYTPAECELMTALAMVKHASPLRVCVRDDFPPSERAVRYLGGMIRMSHNIGTAGFVGSSMCRQMRAANYRAGCDAILAWRRAGDVDCSNPNQRVCRGLWADRLREHAACLATLPLS